MVGKTLFVLASVFVSLAISPDFVFAQIEGQVRKPELAPLNAKPELKTDALLKVRKDFSEAESEATCTAGDKKALIGAGFTSCQIADYCGTPLVKIQSSSVDFASAQEAREILNKMKSYGCTKVAMNGLGKSKKTGQVEYTIFSTDCALSSSHTICDGFAPSLVTLRKGSNYAGDKEPFSQIELCLSHELAAKNKISDRNASTSTAR